MKKVQKDDLERIAADLRKKVEKAKKAAKKNIERVERRRARGKKPGGYSK